MIFLRRPLVDYSEGRLVPTARSALFFGSLLLRTVHCAWRVSISWLTAIGAELLACLLGFLLARILVTWLTRVPIAESDRALRLSSEVMPVNLTSDQQILWQHGFVKLNGTIVTTWAMMIAMSLGAKLITRKLATEGDHLTLAGRA